MSANFENGDTRSFESNARSLRTGLFFDSRCLLHQANYRHVEGPERVLKSYERLVNSGLWNRCYHLQVEGMSLLDKVDVNGRKLLYGSNIPGHGYVINEKTENKSTPEGDDSPSHVLESIQPEDMPQFTQYLQATLTQQPVFRPVYPTPSPVISEAVLHAVHEESHVRSLDAVSREHEFGEDEPDSEAEDDPVVYPDCVFLNPDVFINRYSHMAARLAATGVLELAKAVAEGDLDTGFALIRPPGTRAQRLRCERLIYITDYLYMCNISVLFLPLCRPPRGQQHRVWLLSLQQCGDRCAAPADALCADGEEGADRGLRRAPRQRHAELFLRGQRVRMLHVQSSLIT